MHYRNGRIASNGDVIIQLGDKYGPDGKMLTGQIISFGVLHNATPGNDHCNCHIFPIVHNYGACLCDCLHIDDVATLLAEKGLDKRPSGV